MTYGDLRARFRISWLGLMSAFRCLEAWHETIPADDREYVPETIMPRVVAELERWDAAGHLDRFR